MKGTTRNPITVILFSIITCGIYYFYWIYVTTKEIKNYLNDSEISPTRELVFSIVTFGLYIIYWYYKYSSVIQKEGEKVGVGFEKDFSITILILVVAAYFTCGIALYAALFIFQSKLNAIWEKV